MFNPAHIAVLLSTLMLCILGSRLLRRLPQRGGNRLMIGLALFNIGLYLLKIALICRQPWFNVWEYLPLDLCGVNLFVCLLAALLQKRALYSFLYFIACPAAALALLLPNACFLNCNLFEPVTPRQSRAGLSVAAQPARVCLCAALPACADRYQYADVSAFYLKIPASPYHQGINLSSPVPFCRLYVTIM